MRKNSPQGLTLLESFFAVAILGAVIAILFLSFSAGELSQAASSVKLELQAQARRLSDWIGNDARQAVSWEIADAGNSPDSAHIKFRQVVGWDTVANNYLLSTNYVEYAYDSGQGSVTRKILDPGGGVIQSWNFDYVVQPPFYTRDPANNPVALNSSDLLTSRRLITTIVLQKTIRGGLSTGFSMSNEVKIRNE
ncbi:MAG: hypothetical protein A3G38_00710 [Omnitrophica WOR_2 bacterium RIFCSPLOWO2_12_FULL_51_8]|nr:MAG: hypothetical protein A3G38_00710 [Omnitrophica WOR_2 bacterium RIFCSPLOWO2_12_FULL_51_8]